MVPRLVNLVERWLNRATDAQLSQTARHIVHRDRAGLPEADPGNVAIIDAALDWLLRSQLHSASADGGSARCYSLRTGWSTSYPETTGYLIPTLLEVARSIGSERHRASARRMLDWLVSIQLPCGGFQGGRVDSTPRVPVAFNTGQILLGLAAGESEFGCYGNALRRAGDWLLEIQDHDGAWRRGASPFAEPGDKTYDVHLAWGLIEAARLEPARGYGEAAMANARWTIGHQLSNGWIAKCSLDDPSRPLTHTLGYALRGLLEAHVFSGEPSVLEAARKLAEGLKRVIRDDGFLPGRLLSDWAPGADWACLTGTVQISYCWLRLFQLTGDRSYFDAALRGNRFVRRSVILDGTEGVRGAVAGSFPVYGDYSRLEYPNWAAKFLIDALMLENNIVAEQRPASAVAPA